MLRKIVFLETFIFFTLMSSSAMAIKPCTKQELCEKTPDSLETDQLKCKQLSDLIIVGRIDNFKVKSPGYVDQSFDIHIENIEKGGRQDLKATSFQTGCWAADDFSAILSEVKKQKGLNFRFYLTKSAKEKSGFKIIQYEQLK